MEPRHHSSERTRLYTVTLNNKRARAISTTMNKLNADRNAFQRLGKALSNRHSEGLSVQLSVFQSALVHFAADNADVIKKNPEFRRKFTLMCELIGVDTLELAMMAESRPKKSGALIDAVAIRIVEICRETATINGGFISYKELMSRLIDCDSIPLDISERHLDGALEALADLGSGFETVSINLKKWVRSLGVSGSLGISGDQKSVYELCEFMGGYVTLRLLKDNFNWDMLRAKSVIDEMIMNGFLWVDNQGLAGEAQFWEPSWISK